jgi:hypothetical protein
MQPCHHRLAIRRLSLLKPTVLLALFCFVALGAIRPSFYLDACAWNATEILVLAPTAHGGTFSVIETIKGELPPGSSIELTGLIPTQAGSTKLRELLGGFVDNPFEGVPPIGKGDRLIVFLRRPGALPEYNPRPDLPLDTTGWQPANLFGDIRTSAVWIQDGVTYTFLQTMNPGPTRLAMLQMSEAKLRQSIQAVLQLRAAMDRAIANGDAVERSRELTALYRSLNRIAKQSALQKLGSGGAEELNALRDLLSDASLTGWHQDILSILVRRHVSDIRYVDFLHDETTYWSTACGALNPGWWNNMQNPDVETARNHYTRALALLDAILQLKLSDAAPTVREFATVWRTCPPLDKREKTNQIAEVLKALLEK